MALRRRRIERFLLGSLVVLSVLLTGAITLNFMLHVYETYSESDRLFELWLNVMGIIVNGLFSLGMLYLYSRIGSAQKEQRDLMEEQRNLDENQRTIMREQTNISENQQRLERLRQQFRIDLEGHRPIDENSILVCVSNHGDGVAMNPRLITSVSYYGEEDLGLTFGAGSLQLNKVCEDEYRDKGAMIGAKETGVELSSTVRFLRVTDEGTREYAFPEMATELSTAGVDEISVVIKFEVTDVFGDFAEETMYQFTVSIHPNMTFEEAVQNSGRQ